MLKKNLLGDFTGGTIASVLSLPEAMAFGALVFATITPELTPMGVVVGLISLGMTNLIGSVTGGARILSTGPYALAALMLAQAITFISTRYSGITDGSLILIVFIIVFAAGFFQFLFGLLSIGNLAKFIPYPVIAGLMNGIAILVLVGAVKPLLGISSSMAYSEIDWQMGTYLTALVGLLTAAFNFWGNKIIPKVPAPLIAITLGCAAYYALYMLLPEVKMGSVIGDIPFSYPYPFYTTGMINIWQDPQIVKLLPQILYISLGIAFVITLRSLLAVVTIDNITHENSSTNRELVGQGLANMVTSTFGGISCSGYSGPVIANYQYGGRTRLARATVGAFALLVLMVLGNIVGKLPNAVLAGLLITIGISAADSWSLGLVKRLFSKRINKKLLFDLFLVCSVTGTMVGLGIFQGVAAGVLASVISFVARMSRTPIRRQYDAHRVRSNVERILPEIIHLESHGHKIQIFELDGSLFFGSTDQLSKAILESDLADKRFVILDLAHVTDIDSTGAKILLHIQDRLEQKQIQVLVSGSASARLKKNKLVNELRRMGFFLSFAEDKLFSDIDAALAFAEDEILDLVSDPDRYKKETALEEVDVFEIIEPDDVKEVKKYLERCIFVNGDVIFEQGDPGDHFYLLVQGQIELDVYAAETRVKKRIAILCPGTVCGEMAALDEKPRVATAIARGTTVCYKLSNTSLDRLRQNNAQLAYQVVTGLGRDLAKRMRIANRLATELRI